MTQPQKVFVKLLALVEMMITVVVTAASHSRNNTDENMLSYLSRQEWFRPLIVTLILVILWEFRRRRQGWQKDEPSRQREMTSSTGVISVASKARSQQSRLLDRLEREQQALQHIGGEEKNSAHAEGDGEDREQGSDGGETQGQNTVTNAKSQKSKKKRQVQTSISSQTTTPPPIKATTNHHPGMEGFCHWYDVECSLFRIYTLGRKDDVQVVPPYIPHSYRGTVPIFLHVRNQTTMTIQVNWVDYKGKHISKGKIRPNHVWTQTTYIDHPWVFENAATQTPLLYYVPYRVIPTIPQVPTIAEDGVGRHQFVICPPKHSSSLASPFWVSVKDDVLPFPGIENFPTPASATSWTLNHMSRMMAGFGNTGDPLPVINTLIKYFENIVDEPSNTKYRQIRIASKNFAPIWQSQLRGLLLAIGFVDVGMYAELGCASKPLSPERIQDVALLTYQIQEWYAKELSLGAADSVGAGGQQQPEGADGFGRAGFGRAGHIN